ncbi:MAG TPA: 4-hydroxy-tetrahydrodipicolinate synthase [Acidimicrobiales bacterium]|nr:4-hydroxy-tetrahydrodipicolinate synthase [Acidimicrobiales bacterium]
MASTHAPFGGAVSAMVTPFDAQGAVDYDGAARLAKWQADQGVDGLVVAGTTGEAPVLTDDEFAGVLRAVVEAVTVPVVAGTGTNDTRHAIELTRIATEAGTDGVLVVTPYYNRPSQQGLADHFAAVAGATPLRVLLYDIPVRAGRRIEHPTMLHLARTVPNIIGVKDATGDLAAAAALLREAPSDFVLYSGDDPLTLPFMAVGAVGVISVTANWAPGEMSELVARFAKGDVEGARGLNDRLVPSFAFATSDAYPNPLPAKAALRVLGLPAGQCRLPMGPAPIELDERARAVLSDLGRSLPAAGDGAGG